MARVRLGSNDPRRESLGGLDSGCAHSLGRGAKGGTALLALHEGLGRVVVLVGLALEMDFHALGQKPLAATLAATGKNGAAVFGFHPRAEAELLLASALGGLVGAFHNLKRLKINKISGGTNERFQRKREHERIHFPPLVNDPLASWLGSFACSL